MRRPTLLLAAAFCAATAMAAPPKSGITPANYVEIGDTVVDMLDTTGLAFSTGVLGQADRARPRFTAFTAFTAPTPRTETFEAPCPGGGSISGSTTDRDANGDLSVQDRFVTVFKSCRVESAVVSGSSEFVVTKHRYEGAVEFTELEFASRIWAAMRCAGRARRR